MHLYSLSLAAVLFALSGCGHSFQTKTPSGFVQLEEEADSQYAYRATTADGLVLAVRELEHEPQGDAQFWVNAIENTLRQRGGYALLEKKSAKTQSGLVGTTLRFGHDEQQRPHEYRVTVFVTPAYIYVLEVGGTQKLLADHAADISRFESTFQGG
jgi:hypothetical protein